MVFAVGGSNPAIFRPAEVQHITNLKSTLDLGAVAQGLQQQDDGGGQFIKCWLVLHSWMTNFQWSESLIPLRIWLTLWTLI